MEILLLCKLTYVWNYSGDPDTGYSGLLHGPASDFQTTAEEWMLKASPVNSRA